MLCPWPGTTVCAAAISCIINKNIYTTASYFILLRRRRRRAGRRCRCSGPYDTHLPYPSSALMHFRSSRIKNAYTVYMYKFYTKSQRERKKESEEEEEEEMGRKKEVGCFIIVAYGE